MHQNLRYMGKLFSGKAVVYILATLSILFWGISYIWSNELIAKGIPISYFVSIRIIIAGVILFLANALIRNVQKMQRKDILWFIVLALCEPFLYFICETYGIKETASPTISSMLIASVPIFSIMAGYFIFKENFSLENLLGVICTLAGIGLVLYTKTDGGVGEHFWFGILLLLGAVITEVIQAAITKKLSADYNSANIAMYQFCIGALFFIPLFLSDGLRGFDADVYFSWDVWRPILCLAVFCSAFAFFLWAKTIKDLGVAKSSVFLAMICVVTALASVLTGQEMLTSLQWGGVGIPVVGIIFSQCTKKKA